MSKQPMITLVRFDKGEGWQALYVDGVLKHADHTLKAADVLRALGAPHQILHGDSDWLEEVACGWTPESLADIVLDSGDDA